MSIRTTKKTIPARAESIEYIELTVCDLCGNPESKSQPLVYQCSVCERTVCTTCSRHVVDRFRSRDAVLCSRCYPFRDEYAAAINKLDVDHEAAVEAVMAKWRKESLAITSLKE